MTENKSKKDEFALNIVGGGQTASPHRRREIPFALPLERHQTLKRRGRRKQSADRADKAPAVPTEREPESRNIGRLERYVAFAVFLFVVDFAVFLFVVDFAVLAASF